MLPGNLRGDQCARILGDLDIDPATFVAAPADPVRQADHLFLLRHTLMNPWLLQEDQDGETFVERYWRYLEELVRAELAGPVR